ncbi:MAG: hypothetical protein ACI93R_001212 [Flavobacteriales bacterium]|jgi:hypothetical protein
MPCQLYTIFHLNMAFSSIDQCEHKRVVDQCYWPILNAIEAQSIPIGIELTAYTIEAIYTVAPNWIAALKNLVSRNMCEIIASGDSQIIGPLIPAEVNQKNLSLGNAAYKKYFDYSPRTAYINEQAVSSGLLDIYIDMGFEAVIIEWDNPYSHNPDWDSNLLNRPQTLKANSGRTIKVIWNNAIAFQKFQRYAHAELSLDDYLEYLTNKIPQANQTFCIYGSDAEVFDYRPGRYNSERSVEQSEWSRIHKLLRTLSDNPNFEWLMPSDTLNSVNSDLALTLTNASHPISVKKQAKYNITRWALSGRNDLWLNTQCFKFLQDLKQNNITDDESWRNMCRLWASDIRTHLTSDRYQDLELGLASTNPLQVDLPEIFSTTKNFSIDIDENQHYLKVSNKKTRLTLNLKRGLAIESLSFSEHDFQPICKTFSHGFFDDIRYSADFYSNHLVMERFKERDRVTDLETAITTFYSDEDVLTLKAEIQTPIGALIKTYTLCEDKLQCGFIFPNNIRPEASLRLGYINLANHNERAWFACNNGGHEKEFFLIDKDIDYGRPVSSIVSSETALGATDGELYFGCHSQAISLTWDPCECAPLAMLSSQKINDKYLNRCFFSLIESDETLRPGGHLPNFHYTIKPLNKDDPAMYKAFD